MGFEAKSANNKAPFGDGVAATNVRYFTCDSTSRANALPESFRNKFVRISNGANPAFYFFSKNASATCDETISATDAGAANAALGEPLPASTVVRIKIPDWQPGEVLYFVRASASATTIGITEASD